jgi:hypothetical protein
MHDEYWAAIFQIRAFLLDWDTTQFLLGGVRDEGKGHSVTTALKGMIEQ